MLGPSIGAHWNDHCFWVIYNHLERARWVPFWKHYWAQWFEINHCSK